MHVNGRSGSSIVATSSGILEIPSRPKYALRKGKHELCRWGKHKTTYELTIEESRKNMELESMQLTGFKAPLTKVACVCCSFLSGIEIRGLK